MKRLRSLLGTSD